ncbi:MAG TPA: hypothetical protein VFA00_08330 [Actinomycetota bacterium]|nr:hypothetical protein [Actinomycetota bacterium]
MTCPTLVRRGVDSIATSAEGLEELSIGLPRSEVREVRGESHIVYLKHPEEAA